MLFTIKKTARNDVELSEINDAIHWIMHTNIKHYWEEIYDNWSYPRAFLFRFTNEMDMLLFKLKTTGKQVNKDCS